MVYRFKTSLSILILSMLMLSPFVSNAYNLCPKPSVIIDSPSFDNSTIQIENDIEVESNSIAKNRLDYFSEGNVWEYFKSIFQPYLHYSRMSYVAALLIFLLYLFYFRYIDIYEHELWRYIIYTFLAGILFADFGLLLYDFTTVVLGWSMNGEIINDLLYTVFVIGGIEELVKIIPLLIFLRYTKVINEPIDYIVYAGVGALGFAFSENVMYFDRLGIGIIFSRALTAVVLHTSLSAIVAYGFVLRKYRDKKYAPLKMYFTAMVFHGLYDLFLMNGHLHRFILVAYLFLFAGIIVFNKIVSNSLSNSPYYNKAIHLEIRKIQLLLIGGLASIFVVQFIMLTVSESFTSARESIFSSGLLALFLLPSLVVGFGKIEIHPKIWRSIKIPFLFTKIVLDNEEGVLIDLDLRFSPMTRNRIMLDYFPNVGEVYKQNTDTKNRMWFYVRLNRLGHSPKYNNKHIVIRSKFGNKLLGEKNRIGMAGVYLIKKSNNKPVFAGWCSVEEINN